MLSAEVPAMTDIEKTKAITYRNIQVKRGNQAKKRLQRQLLSKSKKVTINKLTDAVSLIRLVYEFLSKQKMEATKIIVDAVIDMESSNRIPPEQEEERRQYIDFIVSDMINACKSFTGTRTR